MPQSKRMKKLLSGTEEFYTGKKVPTKYQEKYGKVYNEEETRGIGFAIARKRGWKS